MDAMIGRSLGHYRIEAKLGEGGMGVVYRAFDTHLDRPVAIKILRADATASPERKRRFVQEAKAASALNHPNIIVAGDGLVKLLDFGLAKLTEITPDSDGATATMADQPGPQTEEGSIVGTIAYMSPRTGRSQEGRCAFRYFFFWLGPL